jgi:type IV secretory pathway VirD2 relaxase
VPPEEAKTWSNAFKAVIHIVRMTAKGARAGAFGGGTTSSSRRFLQRCAVRVTYSPNRVPGQWAAHGRYITRESATGPEPSSGQGFGSAGSGVDIVKTLRSWQTAGDERLFKLIISPEFGERLDLRRHTHDLMGRMEKELGSSLEWVAVAHFNTRHPHVHIALRGRTETGPLRLPREFVKQGIRTYAEELCTAQLGYRTELDALEGERREVEAPHVTSLDRTISRYAFGSGSDGSIDLNLMPPPTSDIQRARRQYLNSRLRTLETMGLAQPTDAGAFQIDPTFLSKLRAMQFSSDRLKMRAAGRSPALKPRNPGRPGR